MSLQLSTESLIPRHLVLTMAKTMTTAAAMRSASLIKTPFLVTRCLSSQSTPRQSAHISTHPGTQEQFPVSPLSSVKRTTSAMAEPPPLSILPVHALVRGVAINTISSSRILLPISLKAMSLLANSHSPILNPDKNPILRWFLKQTFYAHFCAGENEVEVQRTAKSLKNMGFKGVMLCYAKEVVLDEEASRKLESTGGGAVADALATKEILPWKTGTLETVAMAEPGDFVAVKFTGAGSQALYSLSRNLDPSPTLNDAITEICDLAASRGVRLVFDAEQAALQTGIDAWTVNYMRKYNKKIPGHAVVYCTYQAYLKAAPTVIATHLAISRKEGFTLGAKLVRGAYLETDPRHLINDTKPETDAMYDGLAEGLMRRRYGAVLRPAAGEADQAFPSLSLVLACHNIISVRKAQAIRAEQAAAGEERVDMVYAQLQGMADEVSCELLQAARTALEEEEEAKAVVDVPQAYKYLVWGTTGECMKYLLRRAQENKDAVQRTRDGRNAMVGELVRRVKSAVGLSA